MKTTGTARGQTIVPAQIRKDHQIGSHTQLEWIDMAKLSAKSNVAARP